MPHSTIAIDWSGAAQRADRAIWLAELRDGELLRLEAGRSREHIAEHLAHYKIENPDLIVGLDFAFSLPAWYLESRELRSAPEFWELAIQEGETWLSECRPPFWGRGGTRRPDLPQHFRRTELEMPAIGGTRPKSVFHVNGGGTVGTGSIRGMRMLKTLRDAGFSVWPFDRPRRPLIVEIYPRALTGAVVKSSERDRRRYVEEHHPGLPTTLRESMVGSEDAFDAAISAIIMDRHRREFEELRAHQDSAQALEGEIWLPKVVEAQPSEGTSAPRPRGTYTKSNVFVADDYRDSLIIDRYDSALATMRGAKREALRSENSEDALTWNCFRTLRQIDPSIWLPVLASRAFGESMAFDCGTATVELWRSFEPPPSLRLLQKDEGPSEVDVVIETESVVWFIEAKYKSDISLRTTNNESRDQVLRNIDVGSYFAGTRQFYFSLLTLDGPFSDSGRRRVREYSSDYVQLRESLPHRGDGLVNLAGIGALTWAHVAEALRAGSNSARDEGERWHATQALRWLNTREFLPSA